jgi:hypothetical protein
VLISTIIKGFLEIIQAPERLRSRRIQLFP